MNTVDLTLVVVYIALMAIITWYSALQDRRSYRKESERGYAEKHFLAGRNVSAMEAVFSIVATEFSAITFVQLPALVLLGTQGLIWSLIGILLGRWVISRFLLLNFYRSGLTVFESLAQGRSGYKALRPGPQRARRLLAMIYFFSKILAVSAAIAIGVNFLSHFTGLSYLPLLVGIVALTACYTIFGGLRAVMRTDVLQFSFIALSGFVILDATMPSTGLSGLASQTLSILAIPNQNPFQAVLVGIGLGFVNDFLTHGVEQDFVQKLKACRTPTLAFSAVRWSTGLSLALQLLFALIGITLLDQIDTTGLDLTALMEWVITEVDSRLSPGSRGIVVVGLLAATMSSLDSSINALSSVLWNDILPNDKIARYPSLVIVDNLVVTFFVILFAAFVGKAPLALNNFLSFNVFVLIPLACCFLLRFVLYRTINFDFSLFSLVMVFFGSLIGVLVNSLYFHLTLPLGLIASLVMSSLLLMFYEKLKKWI